MEVPQRLRIVPPVIEQKRVEPDAAALCELAAIRRNDRKRPRLVILAEVAQIVPRVVVEEGTVRMGALALDVLEECPSPLPVRRRADHR